MVYAATQWGVLVLITKVTDPATLGTFALALATTAPIYALLNLNLRGVQATDARERFTFDTYFSHRVASSVLAQAVVQAVVWAAGFDPFTVLVCTLVGLSKGVEAVSDVCYGLFQHRERMDVIGRSMVARGLGAVTVFGALLVLSGDLRVALLGQLVSWTVVLLAYDLPRATALSGARVRLRMDRAPLAELTGLAFPLGIVVLTSSVSHSVPRWALEAWVGSAELGVFAAMAYLVRVGQILVVAVTQAAVPGLARRFAGGDLRGFGLLGAGVMGVGVVVGGGSVLVAAVAGEPLLRVLYTPEYAAQSSLFVWVMVAGAVTYLARLSLHLLTAARWFRAQLPISISGLAVVSGCCAWWVPTQGTLGAVWGWIGGQAVALILALALLAVAVRRRGAEP